MLVSRDQLNKILDQLTHWGRDKMPAILQVTLSIKISLKFVPKGPINNIPALVQIMAWHRSGDKPISEPKWLVYWRIYASLNELKPGMAMLVNKVTRKWTEQNCGALNQLKLVGIFCNMCYW